MTKFIPCTTKQLPEEHWIAAADEAVRINPTNRPRLEHLPMVAKGFAPDRKAIAVATTKYWHGGGVDLTVGFVDKPESALRKRILLHMNAWATKANVRFRETSGQAQVRIARIANDPDWGGYWSYVGTDILTIKPDKPTLNLEAFTMNTPESEFIRVVRHETGHTMGCEHEHMRRELVDRIDRDKAYKYFLETQGWDKAMVDAQVLTALEDSSIMGTQHADQASIMCYQLPGSITKNGQPIIGGIDIDKSDYAFMGRLYPKTTSPTAKPKKKKKKGVKKGARTGAKQRR